jgi:hypothetical protein
MKPKQSYLNEFFVTHFRLEDYFKILDYYFKRRFVYVINYLL